MHAHETTCTRWDLSGIRSPFISTGLNARISANARVELLRQTRSAELLAHALGMSPRFLVQRLDGAASFDTDEPEAIAENLGISAMTTATTLEEFARTTFAPAFHTAPQNIPAGTAERATTTLLPISDRSPGILTV